MYYQNQSYLNRVGNNYKPSQEVLDKRAFDKAMNAAADRIVDMLPELLAEHIDKAASELADLVPPCLATPDPVTRDVMNEDLIRRHIAGKVANRIGHGMSFLQK
ncbi:hypothetical protein [Escherichia coli]|uniref:hypothetical protein n=1 Tax=Escherichia coli TaxID=562 RepID=UPI0024577447|nr:hypothetical protein [Escherichia coli]MDH4737904.1 hypothetical protein [Escherichia coli]MDH4746871.1 hypothetical protein [Escherichia coli]